MTLRAQCPGCGDLAIAERDDGDGDIFWVAVGWTDPVPTGLVDTAIEFCPFCGEELPPPGLSAQEKPS